MILRALSALPVSASNFFPKARCLARLAQLGQRRLEALLKLLDRYFSSIRDINCSKDASELIQVLLGRQVINNVFYSSLLDSFT